MSTFEKYFEKVSDAISFNDINFIDEFMNAGKSARFDCEYDENELAMGVIVEMEHTTNKNIARKIAKDHLAERPDYYSFGKECGIFDELKDY